MIKARRRVRLAAAVQAVRVASGRRHIAAVRVGAVLRGGAAVPPCGGHQIAAVLNRAAGGPRIRLALPLIARLAAVRIVAGAAAGVAIDGRLPRGLDGAISPAAAAQYLAVRRVPADLRVQIGQRFVAIDVKLARRVRSTLVRNGHLVRVRVRALIVVPVREKNKHSVEELRPTTLLTCSARYAPGSTWLRTRQAD